MDDVSVFDRFLSLAKRELSADDVRLLGLGEDPPAAPNAVVARLADGRHIVASFAAPPEEPDVLARRLAMLASTFADALALPPSERTRARPAVGSSLHEELKALAFRARAHDAVVIDADSPVVWGCASVRGRPRARHDLVLRDVSDRELASRDEESSPAAGIVDESGPLQDVAPAAEESSPVASWTDEPPDEPEITRLAIAEIRSLPAIEHLHKGKHVRHSSRDGSYYLVFSFSGIYLLCLVFDGPFDELRAERAAHDALPRIERLVEALPPLDPEPRPLGGVVALRRPRRR